MEKFLGFIELRFRELSPTRRRLVLLASVLGAFLLLFVMSAGRELRPSFARPVAKGAIPEPPLIDTPASLASKEYPQTAATPRAYEPYKVASVDSVGPSAEPRIVYSAALSISTPDFARSRSSLEEILDRHHGYVARLRMVGKPAASVLNATLRVPSSEYRSALTDLKSVGTVLGEQESADEVTRQHNDLGARLLNAQSQEQKLQRMFDERPAQSTDRTPLERQLALLHSEIARMQVEQNAYVSPVAFANISFSLEEEHPAPAETLAAQLKSAALGGFGEVLGTLSAILLFAISRGPIVVLWAALLYLPARFFWRRRALWTLRESASMKTV
jgi:hypothetical protein